MTPSEASQLLDDVKARLDLAKIEYKDESEIDDDINVQITINFPCGRQPRPLYIWDEDDLEAFADIDFESYTLLGNFAAVAHRKKGKIEALLTAPNEPRSPMRRQGILKRLGIVEKDKALSSILLTTDDDNYPKIEIGPPSKYAKVLAQATDQLGISLKISSNATTTYDGALVGLTQKKLYIQQQNVVSYYNWHPLPHEYT